MSDPTNTLEAMMRAVRDEANARGIIMATDDAWALAEAAALAIGKGPWDRSTGYLTDNQLLTEVSTTFAFHPGKLMLMPSGAPLYWENGIQYQFLPNNVAAAIIHRVVAGLVGTKKDAQGHVYGYDIKWSRKPDEPKP